RRTVAFSFLPCLANVVMLIAFVLLFATGILRGDRNPALTYGFGAAALLAVVIVLALPALLAPRAQPRSARTRPGKLADVARFVRESLGRGLGDALLLRRRLWLAVLVAAVGMSAFD